jgi:hypothetical protein
MARCPVLYKKKKPPQLLLRRLLLKYIEIWIISSLFSADACMEGCNSFEIIELYHVIGEKYHIVDIRYFKFVEVLITHRS